MADPIIDLIMVIGPYIVTTILGGFLATLGTYVLFKRKFHEFYVAIGTIDAAIYDDAVTEGEFRAIWEAWKVLFGLSAPTQKK